MQSDEDEQIDHGGGQMKGWLETCAHKIVVTGS